MDTQGAKFKLASVYFSLPDLLLPVSFWQNFISKCLEPKEATITKLNDDGEKLIAAEHPGKNVIEVNLWPYFLVEQRRKNMMWRCSSSKYID